MHGRYDPAFTLENGCRTRDYVSRTLEGDDRFIIVREDDRRLLTCFLEYSAETVQVTDIVHERSEAGWTIRTSSYPKLRLSLEWVQERLEACRGVIVRAESERGRVSLVARRS